MVKEYFALVVAGAVLTGCLGDSCGNEPTAEVVSPDGKLKAITFRRDCGATTKYSIQISVLPARKKLPNEGGNVFVASGEPRIIARWIGDHHLSISGGGSGALKAESSFGDVRITYD